MIGILSRSNKRKFEVQHNILFLLFQKYSMTFISKKYEMGHVLNKMAKQGGSRVHLGVVTNVFLI